MHHDVPEPLINPELPTAAPKGRERKYRRKLSFELCGESYLDWLAPFRHSFDKIVRQTTVPWGLAALALHSLVVRVAASNSAPDAMQELN